MTENRLIFSRKPRYWISRHFLFWFFFWLYFGFLHAANPFGREEIMYFQNLPFTVTESLLMIIPQFFLLYPMLYGVLPFFMRRQYATGVVLTILLLFVSSMVTLFMVQRVNTWIIPQILSPEQLRFTKRSESVTFFMGLVLSMKGSFTSTSIAVCIKLILTWYQEKNRNQQLEKENSEAQLKLLTAQVHPHFLFNTLNNIYAQTQLESPKGSGMIMGLSDLLRYILYEGRKPLVPLSMELDMIREYIQLECVRYDNKLDVHLNLPTHAERIGIAPLLLLPFVENCFKHGTSHVLQNPWIHMHIAQQGETMVMKLMNGKADHAQPAGGGGIGMENVRRRLELLYPHAFDLQITNQEDVFIVDLRLRLQVMDEAALAAWEAVKDQSPTYA